MIFGKPDPNAPVAPGEKPATEGAKMPSVAPMPGTAAPTSSAPPRERPSAAASTSPAPPRERPSAAASTSPAPPRERQAATIRYVDRPDIAETFADAVSGLIFDGQTLRIEFAVTRVDEVKPGAPISGRRYPTCRVVLPPAAAVDLINRMQQIAAALTQAGVVKATPPRSGETPKAR
ncbi:MAG TPA: hypothetical protein VK430_13730 [Xanthobacteraceae bacterium]|nr:hypothetical protein [Xanthobacteraceae bacterium]